MNQQCRGWADTSAWHTCLQILGGDRAAFTLISTTSVGAYAHTSTKPLAAYNSVASTISASKVAYHSQSRTAAERCERAR
eukprot:1226434-Rhodomonas_salina.1